MLSYLHNFIRTQIGVVFILTASYFYFFLQTSYAEDQVLIVGIDDYESVTPKLVGSVNDANNMKEFVIKHLNFKESQITLLLDKEATKNTIINTIKLKLIKNTEAGNRVLFYYSGHGDQIKDISGDEKDHYDETLVAVDAQNNEDKVVNMITDDVIKELFDQITDRQVMIIVDSCHSGTITKGIKKDNNGLYKTPYNIGAKSKGLSSLVKSKAYQQHRKEEPFIPSAKNRIVWTAVSAAQLALVDQKIEPPQGLFTHWFIDGIETKNADSNKDNKVSNIELLNYTRERSNEYCEYIPNCKNGLGVTPSFEAPLDRLSAPFISSMRRQKLASKTIELTNNSLPEKETDSIILKVEPSSSKTNQITIGDDIFIAIESKKPGYLLLLDQNSKGELRQLFPNKYQKINKIEANKNLFVPKNSSLFSLKATELGKSELIAIVTHDKLELDELTKANRGLKIIADSDNFIPLLAMRLKEVWTGETTNRQLDYSLAKYKYSVIKK